MSAEILYIALWVELGLCIGWYFRASTQMRLTIQNQNADSLIIPPGGITVDFEASKAQRPLNL